MLSKNTHDSMLTRAQTYLDAHHASRTRHCILEERHHQRTASWRMDRDFVIWSYAEFLALNRSHDDTRPFAVLDAPHLDWWKSVAWVGNQARARGYYHIWRLPPYPPSSAGVRWWPLIHESVVHRYYSDVRVMDGTTATLHWRVTTLSEDTLPYSLGMPCMFPGGAPDVVGAQATRALITAAASGAGRLWYWLLEASNKQRSHRPQANYGCLWEPHSGRLTMRGEWLAWLLRTCCSSSSSY